MKKSVDFCFCSKHHGDNGDFVTVDKVGATGINAAGKLRNVVICVEAGDTVHKICRLRFIDKKDIASVDSNVEASTKSILINEVVFNNTKDCFLCGTVVLFGHEKHVKRPMKVFRVQTHEISVSIKKVLEDRADEWATQVQGRLEFLANDLRAYDCVYHQKCSVNFRTGKYISLEFENLSKDRKGKKR